MTELSNNCGLVLVKTPCQKSKTRVAFLSCQNIDFMTLQDHFKLFKLSKNNFLSYLAWLLTRNGIFHHFSMVNNNFWRDYRGFRLEQAVVEIWQSATVSRQWLKLGQVWGMNWQTYWSNIIKIIDSLGNEKTEFLLHFYFM